MTQLTSIFLGCRKCKYFYEDKGELKWYCKHPAVVFGATKPVLCIDIYQKCPENVDVVKSYYDRVSKA